MRYSKVGFGGQVTSLAKNCPLNEIIVFILFAYFIFFSLPNIPDFVIFHNVSRKLQIILKFSKKLIKCCTVTL